MKCYNEMRETQTPEPNLKFNMVAVFSVVILPHGWDMDHNYCIIMLQFLAYLLQKWVKMTMAIAKKLTL